jgi:hypothetical protein
MIWSVRRSPWPPARPATQWPLALARKVNASAQHARVGVMKNGVITPVASATENRVYLKPGNRFQLDTRRRAGSGRSAAG